MAIINYINTGSSANKGDGDTLRSAFNKINANFRTLSQTSGITPSADIAASVFTNNALHTGISVSYNTSTLEASLTVLPATTNTLGGVIVGNNLVVQPNGVLSAIFGSTVSDNFSPSISDAYNLGSSSTRWAQLFTGPAGVWLNGLTLTADSSATGLLVNGAPLGIGPQGSKGDTGSVATIEIGTVESGMTASVVTVSTDTGVILNFVLPKGEQGDVGPMGMTGTQGIQGPIGPAGPQGQPGNYSIGNFTFTADVMNMPTTSKLNAGGVGVDKSAELGVALVGGEYTSTSTLVYTVPVNGQAQMLVGGGPVAWKFVVVDYPTLGTDLLVGSKIFAPELNGATNEFGSTPSVASVIQSGEYWNVTSDIPGTQLSLINPGTGYNLTFMYNPTRVISSSTIYVGVTNTSTGFVGVTVDNNNVYLSFTGTNGLVFPDSSIQTTAWSGSYTPANSADWADPAPTTLAAAIDRLAAVVKILNSGTGA